MGQIREFNHDVNCIDREQAPVVDLWPSYNLKVVLDRQTCPQTWFRLYTKKYFAAIIILEDNLFSTDKDRKMQFYRKISNIYYHLYILFINLFFFFFLA
jgi:hypothetical protein